MQSSHDIAELIFKHLTNELSADEKAQLNQWIEESPENTAFFSEVNDPRIVLKDAIARERERETVEEIWEKIKALGIPEDPGENKGARVYRLGWTKIAVAASILLLISAGLLFLLPNKDKDEKVVAVSPQPASDAKPLTNVAKLTLDDGREFILDRAKSGVLVRQDNINVIKQSDGTITYTATGKVSTDRLLYNTISVPKGGDVINLTLEDGSKVWLNAESSIRYPTRFSGDERKVEVTGEAYFEVAASPSPSGGGEQKKRPFIVSKGDMSVMILGTKFNVNAYENEPNIKVTLLEGSVKVKKQGKGTLIERTIKPGQQATVAFSNISVDDNVDLEQVVAWKDGKFVFRNTNIQVIMRQMSRWYNLDSAIYNDSVVQTWQFTGEITRYTNASVVLHLLEQSGGGNFKIEGKKIIISK